MKNIIFSKFSNERDSRFCIRTDILQDEQEKKSVRKSACYDEGKPHIASISEWCRRLNDVYKDDIISMNRCEMVGDTIEFEYLDGQTLESELDSLMLDKKLNKLEEKILQYTGILKASAKENAFVMTPEFKQVFGDANLSPRLVVQDVSNVDLIFSNIITEDGWQVIDYEWTFAFPVPVNFIIYRALHYYIYSSIKRFGLKELNLFSKMGISEEEMQEYEKMEMHFQQYILGEKIPIRNLYQDISQGGVHPIPIVNDMGQLRHRRLIQIYFDYGKGWNQKDSYNVEGREDGVVDLDIAIAQGVKAVRIDPCIELCEVLVKETGGRPYIANGRQLGADWWIFDSEDPQIIVPVDGLGDSHLKVVMSCLPLRTELAEMVLENHMHNLDIDARLTQALDQMTQMKETKVWKVYRKYKDFRDKGMNKLENEKTVSGLKDTKNEYRLILNIDRIELFWDRLSVKGWLVNDDRREDITFTDGNGKKIKIQIDRVAREDVNQIYELPEGTKSGFHISFVRKTVKTASILMEFKNSSTKKTKSLNLLRYNLKAFFNKGKLKNMPMDYDSWIRRKAPDKSELKSQQRAKFDYNPTFSVVIPLFNTPIPYLKEIIESILNQTYNKVQLCLADGSSNDSVQNYIKEHYGTNQKVVYQRLKDNKGISENTNEGLKLATGDFIMLSDHDDVVTPDALYEMVKALNQDSSIDIIYTDEDKVDMDGKIYFDPHFKPDFNLDLLRSNNYICHIFVVRKTIVDKIGEFRSQFDGAQDYDFILRCTEQAKTIYHIPKILYHWRSHPNSTAGNPESKMYAYEAGRAAVAAHFERIGIKAEVTMTEYFGRYRTRLLAAGEPLISIVIPNKDHIDDLSRCITSIYEKSTYKNIEIIIAENNSENEETFAYYEQISKEHSNIKIVYWKHEFNYSAINNFAVQSAKGEYLLFLNNDTEVSTPDWMEEMLGYCQREDCGAVGVKLCYEDDTIQHAGIVLGLGGAAGHIYYRIDKEVFTYVGRTNSTQDISAVTAACMMTPKDVFESVGGFDENLKVAFNDVDYCLKVQQKGKLVVYHAFVELYHYESKSRGSDKVSENKVRFQEETKQFMEKWASVFEKGDPYYNPNLTLDRPDCTLRE